MTLTPRDPTGRDVDVATGRDVVYTRTTTEGDGEDLESSTTTSFEIGAPAWLLTLKFARSHTETRRTRIEHTTAMAADGAGGLTVLEKVLETDEQVADMMAMALERGAEVRDESYRALLGGLVGAAVADRARIDHFERVLQTMVAIDPFTLRVYLAAYTRSRRSYDGGSPIEYPPGTPYIGTGVLESSTQVRLNEVMKKMEYASDERGVEIFTALSELVAVGLLVRTTDPRAVADKLGVEIREPRPNEYPRKLSKVIASSTHRHVDLDTFLTCEWGRYAYGVCMEVKDEAGERES